jgi:hypothetical protein
MTQPSHKLIASPNKILNSPNKKQVKKPLLYNRVQKSERKQKSVGKINCESRNESKVSPFEMASS